ncbi:CO dehydrogenase/acetyl-CoA synthase delta subunit, TIM barrel [Ammonifex degensii KC4]|uniref:CO dehydrogenase/acetyl-CoA synthase delta subunit, TIM barrel n=1 Tax=Ammonifex degensii (strain DSM 10501 / KC4) TaxID=429009 RepID=C9RB71_AMMDK|nr:acetyl-CoA decarbonylase/synthase complex subunit gamma [Ammonifex degensii]ACX51498.1 CO dehydrogenase/acetyl-CoA synthase delta subunit, TIM barrel [Ammonifex degensii KC4]
MGLTGLEIYKLLPKKNCKECGQPTCLAFAMQLAAGKASIEACPYVSEEAKAALGAASAPPIALVKIGVGDRALAIGDETVLFRHDKRFEHPPGLAILIPDDEGEERLRERLEAFQRLCFDRVGQIHCADMVALECRSGDPATFAAAVKTTLAATDWPLVLISEDPEVQRAALEVAKERRPLIYAATRDNWEKFAALAKEFDVPLAVRGENLASLVELVNQVTGAGVSALVLDSGARQPNQVLADQTQIRRQALKRFRPFGFPTITFATDPDPATRVMEAALYIAKYAGIVVFASDDPAEVLPLVTLRLNIYTDPQKPIAVEPKVYEIGAVTPHSPVFVTTNFSLTYFCVASDVEASRVPSYILTVDTDGTSVLTAWAAGKFTPEKIAQALKESGIAEKVAHRKVIIPGGVAVLSGKLQELSGWEVLVGPRESSGIPAFLKQYWQNN